MSYLRNIRSKLLRRKDDVMRSEYQVIANHLAIFFRFCEEVPAIRDIDEMIEGRFDDESWSRGWISNGPGPAPVFPNEDLEKVSLCRSVLRKVAKNGQGEAFQICNRLKPSNPNEGVKRLKDWFFLPLYQYIDERLGDGGELLYLLEKFKVRCEAFERERLYGAYESDTHRGEATLDSLLRLFLFDQGVDYPFSTPRSASGRADIVAQLGSEEPQPLEVKIFSPYKSYDRGYLAKGFGQAFRYATDYNQPFGYLVVFNVSEKELVFETKEDEKTPQRVVIGDKTIFLTIVRLFPDVPASEKGKLDPYIVTEAELTQSISLQ
jgi:hypothetical protein